MVDDKLTAFFKVPTNELRALTESKAGYSLGSRLLCITLATPDLLATASSAASSVSTSSASSLRSLLAEGRRSVSPLTAPGEQAMSIVGSDGSDHESNISLSAGDSDWAANLDSPITPTQTTDDHEL